MTGKLLVYNHLNVNQRYFEFLNFEPHTCFLDVSRTALLDLHFLLIYLQGKEAEESLVSVLESEAKMCLHAVDRWFSLSLILLRRMNLITKENHVLLEADSLEGHFFQVIRNHRQLVSRKRRKMLREMNRDRRKMMEMFEIDSDSVLEAESVKNMNNYYSD